MNTTESPNNTTESPNKKLLRLLLVEDSESDAELIVRLFKRAGFNLVFEQVQTREDMTKSVNNREWDIVLSDYNLPQFDALSALKVLHASGRDIPFIVVSGEIGEEIAVSIMKNGAHDYVMKDNLARLIPAIERELREAELRREKIKSEEERKNLEAQLRQAQKMEAVGQLAGGVAHDFNNMLFVITGCTELMMDDIPSESPLHKNMTMIMGAAQRATTLVRQLLLFSRKSAMQPVIIDINELILNLMKMIRRIIGENISLEFHPGFNLKNIFADPGQIEQVVMNLCINARDAMTDGGKIIIETSNIFIDEPDEYHILKKQDYKLIDQGNVFKLIDQSNVLTYEVNNLINQENRLTNQYNKFSKRGYFIVLTISDTGCGIPDDIQDRIFEPFFTTKEVGKGTGMGLAAVYGIVRSHEGMIHLYSEVGNGTIFKIYIPVAEESVVCIEDIGSVVEKITGNKETILVAEDDESVRKLIVKILENANYKVLSAENGEEAITIFEQYQNIKDTRKHEDDYETDKIDIAILDVVMPKINGDKVMEHIRKVRPDMPIIFLTGYSRGILPETISSQCNYDNLQKPILRYDLLSKIQEVLLKNKQSQPPGLKS